MALLQLRPLVVIGHSKHHSIGIRELWIVGCLGIIIDSFVGSWVVKHCTELDYKVKL